MLKINKHRQRGLHLIRTLGILVLRYGVVSGDSFESLRCLLQLLLKGRPNLNLKRATQACLCMSTTKAVCYRTDDPRRIAVNDSPRVILYLVARRFEHGTLLICVEPLGYSDFGVIQFGLNLFLNKYNINTFFMDD